MEDFDEVDEQNEEDLLLLGDSFAEIQNLKDHILANFKEFMEDKEKYKLGSEYIKYCINQLHEDDQILAKQFLGKEKVEEEQKKNSS